jgi:nucleoid DNA-binding protein
MTKHELAESVANQTEIDKEIVLRVIEVTNRTIRQRLAQGGKVTIRGFGTYKPVLKKRTIGRNIKENTSISIKPKYGPVFKPVKLFKDLVAKINIQDINNNIN